jgi:hypothetical protein
MWKKTHVWTRVSLSKQCGTSVSTLNTIVRNRNIVEENVNLCRPIVKKQNYLKKSRFEELEDILKQWFKNARS